MANKANLKPTTPFTKAFSSALRAVMSDRGITQTTVAKAIGRDQTFVSERTSGLRPCDTDIIAGVAMAAGVEPRTIVREVLAEMRRREQRPGEGGTVTPIRPKSPKGPDSSEAASPETSEPGESLGAVASTEAHIEGAGEFDDGDHID